jgi:hypothetical protein
VSVALGTPVAFVSRFGIDSNYDLWGNRRALDIEKDSVAVSIADILVSNIIRCAPTFECYRVGKVHRLYRCPFSFPQNYNHLAEGVVRF